MRAEPWSPEDLIETPRIGRKLKQIDPGIQPWKGTEGTLPCCEGGVCDAQKPLQQGIGISIIVLKELLEMRLWPIPSQPRHHIDVLLVGGGISMPKSREPGGLGDLIPNTLRLTYYRACN